MLDARKATLVYQADKAHVFEVDIHSLVPVLRQETVLLQTGDFNSCEMFAEGLRFAGWNIRTVYCNQEGDVSDSVWSDCLDDSPFSDQFKPVGIYIR